MKLSNPRFLPQLTLRGLSTFSLISPSPAQSGRCLTTSACRQRYASPRLPSCLLRLPRVGRGARSNLLLLVDGWSRPSREPMSLMVVNLLTSQAIPLGKCPRPKLGRLGPLVRRFVWRQHGLRALLLPSSINWTCCRLICLASRPECYLARLHLSQLLTQTNWLSMEALPPPEFLLRSHSKVFMSRGGNVTLLIPQTKPCLGIY